MSLAELIRTALRERNKTETYAQIEAATGVSATYVHNLVSGKRDPNGITLHVLLDLFPRARIELEPGGASSASAYSDEVERVRLEAERDRLAHELEVTRIERDSLRRELETYKRLCDALDSRVRDLEQRPPCARREETAPYHVGSATLSQSTKTGAPS